MGFTKRSDHSRNWLREIVKYFFVNLMKSEVYAALIPCYRYFDIVSSVIVLKIEENFKELKHRSIPCSEPCFHLAQ